MEDPILDDDEDTEEDEDVCLLCGEVESECICDGDE